MSASESSDFEYVNQTHENIMNLRERFYSRVKPKEHMIYQGNPLPSPIITEAQLMECSSNIQQLGSELEQLIRMKIIQQFELKLANNQNERFFMLVIDYIDSIERFGNKTGIKFVEKIFRKSIAPCVSKKKLEEAGFNEEEIKELVNIKVLLLRGNSEYNLYIPYVSIVISSIENGRKFLVNYLNKKKCKVADRNDVERQTIDDSIFFAEFHVQELLGIGVFEKIHINNRPEQLSLAYNPYLGSKR